jgi:hypothetical protein
MLNTASSYYSKPELRKVCIVCHGVAFWHYSTAGRVYGAGRIGPADVLLKLLSSDSIELQNLSDEFAY